MFTLTRTVRFAVSASAEGVGSSSNGYAGVPAMAGLGAHYELDAACRGEPDATTGYVVSITEIDRAVRERGVPIIARAYREASGSDPGGLLAEIAGAVGEGLAPFGVELTGLLWRLSPFYSVAMETNAPDSVILRQRFEFAASHRLHAPELSDEENRKVYGKCNNPSGHGHNYVVEPAVRTTPGAFGLAQLETLTKQTVIDRFDHKHLNEDLDDFAGTVASVERIAQRCYELLAPSVRDAGAELDAVTVWETEKTSCTYAP